MGYNSVCMNLNLLCMMCVRCMVRVTIPYFSFNINIICHIFVHITLPVSNKFKIHLLHVNSQYTILSKYIFINTIIINGFKKSTRY